MPRRQPVSQSVSLIFTVLQALWRLEFLFPGSLSSWVRTPLMTLEFETTKREGARIVCSKDRRSKVVAVAVAVAVQIWLN